MAASKDSENVSKKRNTKKSQAPSLTHSISQNSLSAEADTGPASKGKLSTQSKKLKQSSKHTLLPEENASNAVEVPAKKSRKQSKEAKQADPSSKTSTNRKATAASKSKSAARTPPVDAHDYGKPAQKASRCTSIASVATEKGGKGGKTRGNRTKGGAKSVERLASQSEDVDCGKACTPRSFIGQLPPRFATYSPCCLFVVV